MKKKYLVLFTSILSLLTLNVFSQDRKLERWLNVVPGKKPSFSHAPMAREPNKGFSLHYKYEGIPQTLNRLCDDFKRDWESATTASEDISFPDTSEITRLQQELLEAAKKAETITSPSWEIPVITENSTESLNFSASNTTAVSSSQALIKASDSLATQ